MAADDADDAKELEDSRTYENLLEAFAADCKAAGRYGFFALKARKEGQLTAAAALSAAAESKLAHAHGQLEFLADLGDPQTHSEIGPTGANLRSAVERCAYEHQTLYEGFARTAREEGFDVVGTWFETLAAAGRNQARALKRELREIDPTFSEPSEERVVEG